jgi:hypothetical protein
MEATTDEHGVNRVTMTDDDSLWVYTGEGEVFHIFRGFYGVKMTLWAKKNVPYSKTTQNKTIITLQPTQNK